jgi:hypothetical protein
MSGIATRLVTWIWDLKDEKLIVENKVQNIYWNEGHKVDDAALQY